MNITSLNSKIIIVLHSVFFLLAYALLFALPETVPVTAGADASSWLAPAYGLLAHKAFVMVANPEIPNFYRPPVISVFNAIFLWLGGEHGIRYIISAQIILLSLTTLITSYLAEKLKTGLAVPVTLLLLFNPNNFSTALLIQSETVFTFLFMLATMGLIFSIRAQKIGDVILCGLALGLATLTRPTTQYLIIVLPVVFLFLTMLTKLSLRRAYRSFLLGIVCMVVALCVIAPWAIKVSSLEQEYTLTTSEIEAIYIWDQVLVLDAISSGSSIKEAGTRLRAKKYDGYSWEDCNNYQIGGSKRVACFKGLVSAGWSLMGSYELADYTKAIFRSAAYFFMTGAAGNWHNLLDVNSRVNVQSWYNTSQDHVINLLKDLIQNLGITASLITGICLIFSASMKLLAALGFVHLVRYRKWPELMVYAGTILYFIAAALFLGQSRYRVPAEPALMVLAASGLSFLFNKLLQWKNTHWCKNN